ncbi:hypothetical protein H2199_009169 [Coniosporium tulheliwenetii]|uniref:Uncharacterized protein n=1 Tax=Coniosporium tulheliwenetii TaxID=3383036 RepID=A0ACC2YFJ0_9PEZI|nr:hypothetical protein H2199_009169 [Cladosporium sp. JES 115]
MDQSQDEEDIESVATDELIELMERALLPQLGSEGLSNFLQQTISDSLRRQSPPNLLVLAVSSCDGDEVDRLLRKGVDVDAMDGALESADINVVDHYGRVPLHTAAMTRPFPTLVPLLLELGADPNVPDGEGVTPLRFAVETPEYANEAVPALLQRGAHVGTRDNKGRSPLHSAISDPTNGLSEASLRMLISHAADIDEVVTINGEPLTPLLMAIKGRHPLAVRLLLEHPINLERPGEKKMNPLHFAVMYRNIDITPALKGDEACATTLLNHGASVDARDEAAQTPLHIAIKYRNVEVAKLLLEAGADANSRDDKGRSPLHIAVDEADELCIALLLKHRANVTAKDWRLYTPRHIVQEKIREEFNLGDQDDATENENADGDDQDWEDVSDNEESGVAELDEPSNGEDQTPRQTWLRIAELLMEAEAEQDPLTERLSPSPRPAGWCSNLIKTRILCAQREYSPPAEQPIIERESTPKAGILSPNQESSGLVKTGALGTEMESCEPMRAESRGDKANVGLIDDENEEEEETSLNVDEEAGQGVMGFRVGAVLVLNYVHDYLNMHRNSVTPEGLSANGLSERLFASEVQELWKLTSPTGVNTSSVEPEFLMLCIPESRGTTRLVCNDLSERRTDEEVFTGLKEQYNSRRWWSWARISAISHIEWKQFHIYHSDRVAISAHQGEDWPTCERPHCTTGCSHAVEYSYAPAPAPLDPPIPRAAMMHFFHNPSHAGTKTFHRASMPKRKDRLKLRPNDNIREGWGLVFKERVCWTKVAVTEGLIGMVSLIFAVTWSKTHGGNVQDAFAPSSWLLALGAVVLTLIYQYEQAG